MFVSSKAEAPTPVPSPTSPSFPSHRKQPHPPKINIFTPVFYYPLLSYFTICILSSLPCFFPGSSLLPRQIRNGGRREDAERGKSEA